MNPVFQIVITAYLFLVYPFCLGILDAALFPKHKKNLSEIITNGYLDMMAIFCAVAVPMIRMQKTLAAFGRTWMVLTLVLSAVSLCVGHGQIRSCFQETGIFWKNRKHILLLAITAVSIILSVAFTRPGAADATVEILNTSLQTDSMYRYDPYTGDLFGTTSVGSPFSPIEMLYAAAVAVTGLSSSILVYYLLPVFLLPIFFAGMWRLGGQFFDGEEQRIGFVLILTALYWMTAWMEGRNLATGVFLNCWNGLTLLSCVIFPITLGVCMGWMKEGKKEGFSAGDGIQRFVRAGVLVMSGQLTYRNGGLYVLLMLFLCMAVYLVRRGYRYGIASGLFKKHL